MALQIRRGVDGSGAGGRLTVTPAAGELLYTTDTKLVYVGDGTTVGGNILTSPAGLSNMVEDTTPQLGGDLDVNGRKIVSASNGNIELDPDGTGSVILHGNLIIDANGNITKTGQLNITPTTFTSFGNNNSLVDGNIYITRNSYSNFTGSGVTFAQHHETADAVNFTFYRTRGTGVAPTAVVNGDDVADLAFTASNGTATVATGAISAIVDGVPAGGQVPMKFQFLTNNGTAIAARAELSATGVWRVNSLQNFSGSSLTLTATTVNVAGNMQLNAQNDLRFADADSSNWVAFQAPSAVSANVTWTLPSIDGTTGQVLTTNGGGTLSWATAGAGGSLASRSTVSGVTGSLADAATGNVDISAYKGYMLYTITTSHAAWVRLYVDDASRTADASRLEGNDPLPGAGVIAEVITTGAQTVIIGTVGFNNETSPTTNIPVAVTNKSGGSAAITVSMSVVQLEA